MTAKDGVLLSVGTTLKMSGSYIKLKNMLQLLNKGLLPGSEYDIGTSKTSDTACHSVWTQRIRDSRQMRTETEAPKLFLMQVISCSCFASHFGTLELWNLSHFYWTACAECKKRYHSLARQQMWG